jgi:hypothetical protein
MNFTRQMALLFASNVAVCGAAIAQQTPRPNDRPARISSDKLTQGIVLASADSPTPTSANVQSDQAPHPKRPAPRITSCRCGDPVPEIAPDEQ